MDGIEFANYYQDYISQLEEVVRWEYLPFIKRLRERDPHEVVEPEHLFLSEAEAVGVVFKLFMRQME